MLGLTLRRPRQQVTGARDSVTGYAALHDTVTSRHTGPGPRGIFPAKTHDDGSDKLASFLAPHITELALANISQDGDNFPVYFFKAINCKISD